MSPWSERLGLFAALPNVACKLSGLVTEADWAAWIDRRPRARTSTGRSSVFGPDRLLFGSDWPVSLLAASYAAGRRHGADAARPGCPPESGRP